MEVNFIACCSVSRVLCLWTGEKGVEEERGEEGGKKYWNGERRRGGEVGGNEVR